MDPPMQHRRDKKVIRLNEMALRCHLSLLGAH